jgi:hypothetical protein
VAGTKKQIRKLKRADGSWCNTPNEMQCMAREFFVDLFTADSEVSPCQVLGHIEAKVSDSMNDDLCREFSERNIRCNVSNRAFEGIGAGWLPGTFLSETLGYNEQGYCSSNPKILP